MGWKSQFEVSVFLRMYLVNHVERPLPAKALCDIEDESDKAQIINKLNALRICSTPQVLLTIPSNSKPIRASIPSIFAQRATNSSFVFHKALTEVTKEPKAAHIPAALERVPDRA